MLQSFDSLEEYTLCAGPIASGENKLEIAYQGLALLTFAQGQAYTVIIGNEPLRVHVESPDVLPSFPGSGENGFLYAGLQGREGVGQEEYAFARLLLEARGLLDSSTSVRTIEQLRARKGEFETFVKSNYGRLWHSDMVRRLIAQYFMMHELNPCGACASRRGSQLLCLAQFRQG